MKRALVALLLVGGCAHSPPVVTLQASADPPDAKRYFDVLDEFTRHGHILADFDETLTVDASLISPLVADALAAKRAEVYELTRGQAEIERAKLEAEANGGIVFHLESATHNFDLNDFASSRSIWRLTLMDDQGHVLDHPQVKSAREKRQVDQVFYPYTSLFGRAWDIRFPRALADGSPFPAPGTRTLTLRIAGPMGTVDLVWKLK